MSLVCLDDEQEQSSSPLFIIGWIYVHASYIVLHFVIHAKIVRINNIILIVVAIMYMYNIFIH